MPKKRKDGRYQRKLTLSDGRQKMVYGRTLAELNAAADAVRDEDRQGIRVGDSTLVGEWAKIWLEKYKADLRPNTKAMYRNAYNTHILDTIGNMPLRDVKPVHIREVMSGGSGKIREPAAESADYPSAVVFYSPPERIDCKRPYGGYKNNASCKAGET